MDISVVLPVYNQADHIESVLEQYLDALANLTASSELLVVINGARRDASLEICRSLAARRSNLQVFAVDEPGWGRAVRFGLSQARGRLLCYTNTARTKAMDLVVMLTYGLVNADTVIKANRKIRASVFRRMGSLLYNLECRALFDLSYWDINGTPKVFPRSFTKLLELQRNDDLIDLEFAAICRREGYRVIEVPIFSSSVRHSGASTTNIRSAIQMYRGALRLKREGRWREPA
jgi:glycosyltransferase involved in cell wall biosynthesis